MQFKKISFLLILIFFTGCEQYKLDNSKKVSFKPEMKFKNTGFALINDDDLNNQSNPSNLEMESDKKIENEIK